MDGVVVRELMKGLLNPRNGVIVTFAANYSILPLSCVRNFLQVLGLRIQVVDVKQMPQGFLQEGEL